MANNDEEMDVSDREQKEIMEQQMADRNKLKHEALNRIEKKKSQIKGKKPRTAMGSRRTDAK